MEDAHMCVRFPNLRGNLFAETLLHRDEPLNDLIVESPHLRPDRRKLVVHLGAKLHNLRFDGGDTRG
jgi:hypothetical protein